MSVQSIDVAASTDDAHGRVDGGSYNDTLNIQADAGTTGANSYVAGMRFASPAWSNGDTINAATVNVYVHDASFDDPSLDIHCDDQISSPTFSAIDKPADRVQTTASSAWAATALGVGTKTSPDFASALQEVTDLGSGPGTAVSVLFVGRQTGASLFRFRSFDTASPPTQPIPQLNVTYTAGGGGTTYNDSISFSATGSASFAAALTANAPVSESATAAASLAAALTANAATSQSASAAMTLGADATFEAAIAAAATAAEQLQAACTFVPSLSFDGTGAASLAAAATFACSAAWSATAAASVAGEIVSIGQQFVTVRSPIADLFVITKYVDVQARAPIPDIHTIRVNA